MKGELSDQVVVGAPAAAVWDVYSTLQLSKVCCECLPDLVERVEIIEGDGCAEGSALKAYTPAGSPGPEYFKERFVKMDHANRVKEAKQIGGGYLALGFVSYLVRFEIIEKDADSSIVKTTIEYEIDDGSADKASLVSTEAFAVLAKGVEQWLTKPGAE